MKIVKKNIIDCILFSFKGVNYLLPSVAFAELGIQADIKKYHDIPVIGLMDWRGYNLPVVLPDLSDDYPDVKTNYAVINALFLNKSVVPYFGLIIDSHPSRMRLRPQEISWIDEKMQLALCTKDGMLPKEVVIVDLQKFSSSLNTFLNN